MARVRSTSTLVGAPLQLETPPSRSWIEEIIDMKRTLVATVALVAVVVHGSVTTAEAQTGASLPDLLQRTRAPVTRPGSSRIRLTTRE